MDLGPRTASDPSRTALVLVLVGAAIRLMLATIVPPVPDETYYWEWSRRLAGGYFDHPYGIAVSIRAGTTLFAAFGLEPSPLAIRVVPVLQGLVAALAAVAIARRIGGPASALRAAIVITVLPLAATGLVLATPDAPLLAATGITLYAVVRALHSPRGSRASLGWWLLAGAGAGAAMASKYTGVLVPAGVFVALTARATLRTRLAEAGPYAAFAVALLVLLPMLAWNAAHDWVSFGFQLRHGLTGPARGTPLGRELELIGGQAALVSPILFVLLAVAVRRALRNEASDEAFMLAVVASGCFGVFMLSALRKPVEANWPALAYVPAIPILASAAFGKVGWRWFRAGWLLAATLTATIYAHAVASILPIPPRRDPIARSAGWDALARAAEATRDSLASEPSGRRSVHVAAERYQDASELAFHMRGRPLTYSLNLVGRPNQYDLWPSFARRARPGDALVVVVDETPDAHRTIRLLEPHFARVRRGSLVELRARRGVVTRRRVWSLLRWGGSWPASRAG